MRRYFSIIGFIILFAVGLFFIMLFSPITAERSGAIAIVSDESVGAIANDLRSEDIIYSSFVFKVAMRVSGVDKKIVPGEYDFSTSDSLFDVIHQLSSADYRKEQKKVVIPEGSNVADIGELIQKTYPDFDKTTFDQEALIYEGYLFPDTYDFSNGTSTSEVISIMRTNFDLKTKALHDESDAEGRNWGEVVNLASIIEEEGKFSEDRKLISGILQTRLGAGIALQVDSEPDTYQYPGLPPAPITNPGLESLDAAVNPEKSDYLYFLTGKDGAMHYAKTFEEHLANTKRYL